MSDNGVMTLTVDELLTLRRVDARLVVVMWQQVDAYRKCLAEIERNLGHVLAAIEPVSADLADMVRQARNDARRAQGKNGVIDV